MRFLLTIIGFAHGYVAGKLHRIFRRANNGR